jgi:hypothetical protein
VIHSPLRHGCQFGGSWHLGGGRVSAAYDAVENREAADAMGRGAAAV